MSEWIDISIPITAGMLHWPSDPDIVIKRISDMDSGGLCNVTQLSMTAHTGTHMDAPLHFVQSGAGMETMPPEATIGVARVVEVFDSECIREEHLDEIRPASGERLLFKTQNSTRSWNLEPFNENFIYISAAAARRLAEAGVQTVGIDYLSVGGFHRECQETHLALLNAGVWILEGLNLQHVEPGIYDLVCLPIKLSGSDGAPARAVLRRSKGDLSFEHR